MYHGSQFLQVVVGGVGIDDDAVVASAFIKINFPEVADLDRRVDEAVIVRSLVSAAGVRQRCGNAPSRGQIRDVELDRPGAVVDGIHQDLGEIEEGMMLVQLSAVRTRQVGINLVIHFRAGIGSVYFPQTLIQAVHGEWLPGGVLRTHPVHVLRKITDLVKRIPDG